MMPRKHLHELLKEDQEPFLLTDFIADKRSLLKRPPLRLCKRRPISDSSDFAGAFCRSACFLSFRDSPDFRKSSPLFEFHSPVKSPCRTSNAVFLHVPARTAGMLLEAALRILKQSAAAGRSKAIAKPNGFGLLGSFLKRFTHRGRARKREIDGDCRGNDHRGDLPLPAKMAMEENERENDSVSQQSNVTSFDFCQTNFCDSPFRFVLQSSGSTGHLTPEFSSPARLDHQVNDVESLNKFPVEDEEEEEEEEKEQSSPVSVLDPPFEDDDEGHYEDGADEDDYNLERSYAIVQKAKHQLLKKLRRFERLAELDPVDLEMFLLKDEEEELDDDDDIDDHLKEEEEYETEQRNIVANESSGFQIPLRPTKDTKKLARNLITKEERDLVAINKREETTRRVYVRSDLWKRVDSHAIDETVGQDLKAELDDGGNKNGEQRGEIAMEIELAIFSLLVEEMQSELHCLTH